jgi:peptide/nickel transport system permease protein
METKNAEVENRSGSLTEIALRKLRKNKLAMISLGFIGFLTLVAILGYTITPDSTPNANDQHLELAACNPGFTATFLKLKQNQEIEQHNFFYKMLFGQETEFTTIPIYNYKIVGDSVVAVIFTGDKSEKLTSTYNLLDALFAIDPLVPVQKEGNIYTFRSIEGRTKTVSSSELKVLAKEHLIETRTYLLGTDRFGRDLLSRLILGTRISLSVGFVAVGISLIIGLFLGATAGYYGKTTDLTISWLTNVFWSVPTLLVAIAITLLLGKGFWQVFVAIGLTMWVEVARVVRGQVLGLREKEFVEAAKVIGSSNSRIIFRHILPNAINPVIIISASNFSSAILIEAGLSFLGIGVQPPTPTWGGMVKDHYGYIILDSAYMALLPGLAIMVTVLAFNIIGNGLRDALDTKESK